MGIRSKPVAVHGIIPVAATGFFFGWRKMQIHSNKARHLKLDSNANHPGAVRFLTSLRVLPEHSKSSTTITLTRTGHFYDPRYGNFDITKPMLLSMVANFKKRVYGQDIFIDVAHKPENGAAAKVLNLSLEGNRLRARVEWTQYGVDAVVDKGYVYLSAEFHENFKDNEKREEHGPTLLGAGLTIRPVIKNLDPVDPESLQLSEEFTGGVPTYMHSKLIKQLSEAGTMKWIDILKARLRANKKLSENQIEMILAQATAIGKQLGEVAEDKVAALVDSFDEMGKKLSEAVENGDKEIKLSLDVTGLGDSAAKTLSTDDLDKAIAKQLAQAADDTAAAARKLAEDLEGNIAIFDAAVGAVKGLSESTLVEINKGKELITGDMSPEKVTELAVHQVAMGEKLQASTQLSAAGYSAAGSVVVSVGDSNDIKSLQADIDTALKGTSEYINGNLVVPETNSNFVNRVLAEFDAENMQGLRDNHKVLAGGSMNTADIDVPAAFQRTVIREALSDLNILNLVKTDVDPSAAQVTDIPYEERDMSQVANGGIVYEGQGIHAASVGQKMDTAFVRAFKLAMKLSNEVMHFTKSSALDWDAFARNAASNARILRELITRDIGNQMLRASDAYGAVEITAEDFAAQLDGITKSLIKTAEFPVVRPHQDRNMRGDAMGLPENPITITINGVEVQPWDGTGDQTAGFYYNITSVNLGYIQFVDETGAAATPTAGSGATITYSHATNVVKFDTDLPAGVGTEKHMNGLLRAFGRRKAVMSTERFIKPNFALMSDTLNDEITTAENFIAHSKRDGTDTTAQGDLEKIKAVPAWGTNAPHMDLGEERILLGQRGTTTYKICKAYALGQPVEAFNDKGQPTGEKIAYGEEYNAVHTPKPIRLYYTSILAYSASSR